MRTEDSEAMFSREEDVSETEIQNIINHYKKLGKNEENILKALIVLQLNIQMHN